MPPLPYNTEAKMLHGAAKRLGWHPFPIPMAINSVEYQGRPACIMCPHCVGFACEVKAKGSTANTVIPKAIETGHCELRTGCIAAEVIIDARGRARAVTYFKGRQSFEQPCKLVVVSLADSPEIDRRSPPGRTEATLRHLPKMHCPGSAGE